MKPFDFYLRFMSMTGIWRKDNSLRDKLIGIGVNCVFVCLFSIFLSTSGWFFFFTAEKFAEYTECLYSLICAIIIPVFYFKLFWQKETFDMYFTDLNVITEESGWDFQLRKLILFYEKTNKKQVFLREKRDNFSEFKNKILL